MSLIRGLWERIDVPLTVTVVVNSIRWENPLVWLLLPFWLPLVIVLETVALIIVWTTYDQNRGDKSRTGGDDAGDDTDDEDEHDDGPTFIDLDAMKSLMIAVMMLPFLVPAAMIRIIIDKIRHSKFRFTPGEDPQIYSYKSWKYQKRQSRRLTFSRKE